MRLKSRFFGRERLGKAEKGAGVVQLYIVLWTGRVMVWRGVLSAFAAGWKGIEVRRSSSGDLSHI